MMLNKPVSFLFIMIFIVLASAPVDAVKLTVKRAIFEEGKRSEVITVINSTNREVTYRVGWRHFVMTSDKALNAVSENDLPPEVKPVSDMIRFAPRRFTLPPKDSQQVRLILRMRGDVADGEYRSHLWIRPEESVEKLKFREELAEKNRRGGRASGVAMRMLTGVTMPIIVRKGNLAGNAKIVDLSASQTSGFVNVTYGVIRSGEASVYGNKEYVCNEGTSSEYLLRSTKGIAIYPEVDRRNFSFRIPKEADEPSCSSLTLAYYGTNKFQGNADVLFSKETVSVN